MLTLGLFLTVMDPVSAQDRLSPDAQFEALRLEMVEAARRDRHKNVIEIADRMRRTGLAMPVEILFLEGKAFHGLGAPDLARRAFSSYLKAAGRKGKNYDEALRLYVGIRSEISDRARNDERAEQMRNDYEAVRAAWASEKERAERWKRYAVVFGGPEDDSATAMTRSADGGVVLAGSLHIRRTHGDEPIDVTLPWITAFDRAGRRVWHRPLGAARDPGSLRSIVAVSRRGYLFGGAQNGFQIAAITDSLGNMVGDGDGDPWIISFAPLAGDGAIARLLKNGDILALGTEEIGKDDSTGKAGARLPVAVRLSAKGKAMGKAILARDGAPRWYDVRDALVLGGGDVVVTGEMRPSEADATNAEGYVIRISPEGKERWSRRVPSERGQGTATTALAPSGDGFIAVGRDGTAMSYLKFSGDGSVLWRRKIEAPADSESVTRFCATPDVEKRLALIYASSTKATDAKENDFLADFDAVRAHACRASAPFAVATAITERPGGYLILGIAGRDRETETRITMTAIDDAGSIVWRESQGDGPFNLATSALATGDGGFVVAGVTTSWERDVVLFKTDAAGTLMPFSGIGSAAAPPAATPETTPKTQASPETLPPVAKPDTTDSTNADKRKQETAAQDKTAPRKNPDAESTDDSGVGIFDLLGGMFGGSSKAKPEPGQRSR
ncbi:MAG: hypothetical protein AB7P12_04835 [Alphaproteobacteria bacterium]